MISFVFIFVLFEDNLFYFLNILHTNI